MDTASLPELHHSATRAPRTLARFLDSYRSRPNVALGGHTRMCRFLGVNDVSGDHT